MKFIPLDLQGAYYILLFLLCAHIAASHAHDAFAQVAEIHVEDLLIDIFYLFDKSTKERGC